MNLRVCLRLLALLFVAVTARLSAVPQAAGIARVSWLQGCWQMQSGDRIVEEQWIARRGKTMIGVGRTVRGESLVEYELVVLREEGNQLAYEAHPSGQPSAVFLSRTVTDSNVVFENLQHDFSQRIGYERKSPNE